MSGKTEKILKSKEKKGDRTLDVFTTKSRGRYKTQVTGHRSQVTGHRSQVTGHRSQVTDNAIKKLGPLLGSLCLHVFICFISGYVTTRHMCGIDHASRCSKSKRTKYRKVTHCIRTRRVLSPVRVSGDLETRLFLCSTRRNLD